MKCPHCAHCQTIAREKDLYGGPAYQVALLGAILDRVAAEFRISGADIRTGGKSPIYSRPRQIAMTIAWRRGLTQMFIAAQLSMHHTVITHGIKRVLGHQQWSAIVDRLVEELKSWQVAA